MPGREEREGPFPVSWAVVSGWAKIGAAVGAGGLSLRLLLLLLVAVGSSWECGLNFKTLSKKKKRGPIHSNGQSGPFYICSVFPKLPLFSRLTFVSLFLQLGYVAVLGWDLRRCRPVLDLDLLIVFLAAASFSSVNTRASFFVFFIYTIDVFIY